MSLSVNTGSDRAAVIFCAGGKVIKQMLFSEFEAILDSMVAISEFSGKKLKAIYTTLNGSLDMVSVVCFTIGFDSDGLADSQWNLPLSALAGEAKAGPDLGAGPIRLACRSQCPINMHQDHLWDPPLTGKQNLLAALAKLLKTNQLGLDTWDEAVADFEEFEEEVPTLDGVNSAAQAMEQKERARLARTIKDLRLQMSMLKADYEDQLARVRQRQRDEIKLAKQEYEALEMKASEEAQVNERLQASLKKQAGEFQKLRELVASQIEQVMEGQAAEQQLELEIKARIEAATVELQGELERKDVELFYRDEQIKRVNETIEALQQQKQALQEKAAGGDLMRQLQEAGISYTAYQPGAGQFTVPREELLQYVESPLDYAAARCMVDVETYRAWVAHSEKPVCTETNAKGKCCGMPVHRVDSPSKFDLGESDRCSQHKVSGQTIGKLMKANGR